jgi:hypothetical protein
MQPTTTEQLLARIRPARAALERVVAALSDEALVRDPGDGQWPVSGHLTHIAAWERMFVAHMRAATDHEIVEMSAEQYAGASLDEINARIYRLHEGMPADAVRAEFAASHAAIVGLIEELTPAELQQPYWPDDSRTVAEKITGDTYLHYGEHEAWIAEATASGRVTR